MESCEAWRGAITQDELDEIIASVTPERLRALAPKVWGTARRRGRTVVQVMALIDGLTAGLDKGDGGEHQRVVAELRRAIQAAMAQMPEAKYLEGP